MKQNYKIVALVIGLSTTLSMTAFSQEKKDKKEHGGNKQAGAQHHAENPQQHVVQQQVTHENHVTQAGNVPHQNRPHAFAGNQGQGKHAHQQTAAVQNSNFTQSQIAQSSGNGGHAYRHQNQIASGQSYVTGSNRQISQTVTVQGGNQHFQPQVTPNNQYNSGNNYGGYWSDANSHNDWNHDGQHYWNNHNYRWYQGGWLIIDAGFNPYYVNPGYSSYGSPVASVQTSLTNLGYYNGPIDGDAGPGTRNAIASYQNDNNLEVTGHINGDLLHSLQLTN